MEGSRVWPRVATKAVAAAAVLALLAVAAMPATRRSRPKPAAARPAVPSYTIPNTVAAGMCVAVLAIACKRSRKS